MLLSNRSSNLTFVYMCEFNTVIIRLLSSLYVYNVFILLSSGGYFVRMIDLTFFARSILIGVLS